MGERNYEPSQSKAFGVSKDKISRERLDLLMLIIKEVQNVLPGVDVSMSLFGSLSKGKEIEISTAHATDVDAILYVDLDQLTTKYNGLSDENSSTDLENQLLNLKRQGIKMDGDFSRPVSVVRKFYSKYFSDRLSERGVKLGLAIISNVELIRKKGEHSIMHNSNLLDMTHNGGHRYATQINAMVVGAFFQLDVGGKLKKYKQQFFSDLAVLWKESPRIAQEKWSNTLRAIQFFARGSGKEDFENFQLDPKQSKLFPPPDVEATLKYFRAI